MKITLNNIAAVFAICFVAFPTSAISDENNMLFLFEEKLEHPYSNGWSGMLGKIEYGQADVYINSTGKSAEFDGILSINCTGSGHFWKAAGIGGENANPKWVKEAAPREVIAKARKAFCK